MKKFTFIIIAIAAMFTSCSDMADFTAAEVENNSNAIFSDAYIVELTSNTDKNAAIIAQDAMDYVTTVRQNYDDVYKFNAKADGTLKIADKKVLTFPVTENCLNLYGVIPATAAKSAAVASFAVQLDQTTEAARIASDLMIGAPKEGNPVFPTAEAVAMEFKHKLAEIHINLTAGEGVSADDLKNASVSIVNTKVSVDFDPVNGSISSATGETASIKVIENANGMLINGAAVIVPQDLQADVDFITVTLANGKVITYAPMIPVHIMSGKAYNYNVTVNAAELNVVATMSAF